MSQENTPAETPIQRAFRLKQEAMAQKEKAPRGGAFQREQNKRIDMGKSRPWMTK